MSRTLYLASNNRHKLDELGALLAAAGQAAQWTLRLARDLDPNISWDETGDTFEANARIKADAVRARLPAGTRAAVLADDSGLAVDALNGAPGVHSSRYAGRDGDDAANNVKLLNAMEGVPDAARSARFVCVLCFVDETGTERFFRGECPGTILRTARGGHGFGYDPLFAVAGTGEAMAEMSAEAKNAISHRGRAVAQFLAALAR